MWISGEQNHADLFTKAFSNPVAFQRACELVGICLAPDIEEMCGRADQPPADPTGGGKSGDWCLFADGSGYWSRVDTSATRYRTLRLNGPKREEVTCRVTWDLRTGEMVGEPMWNYSTAPLLSEELPLPHPRNIRTEFHFDRTKAKIPTGVRVLPLESAGSA